MTVPFDPVASRPAPVWEPPVDPQARVDEVPPAGAASQAFQAVPGDGTRIDGNATNQSGSTRSQTVDGKPLVSDPIEMTANVTITRERTYAEAAPGQYYVSSDQLVFATGNQNDRLQVSQNADGSLGVDINGERYEVNLARASGVPQEFTIRSNGGDDTIEVAPDVKVNFVVDGGAGNDRIVTAAGHDRIEGGQGNDIVQTGAGLDYVAAGAGDDTLDTGAGRDVAYGGSGDDAIAGGDDVDYLDGGDGRDTLDGGADADVLSGGLGEDRLSGGTGADRVYAGAGADTIVNTGGRDVIYAQRVGDTLSAADGASNQVVNVELNSGLGLKGVRVEGSEAFRQRIEDDLAFLRSSPSGQRMLAEFDRAAAQGNTVTIRELQNEQNGFALSAGGTIANQRPGQASDVDISYNPSFFVAELPAPSVILYHEMSHAYNGVNGTFLPGDFNGRGSPADIADADAGVPNAERQAVGLDTTAPAYDFDRDPATPPTTHNPIALTENGMREEMGLPLRPSYALDIAAS